MAIKSVLSLAALLALSMAAPAQAGTLLYKLTGAYSASWTIDTLDEADEYIPDILARYLSLSGTFPNPDPLSGLPPFPVAEICFYDIALDGGLEIDEDGNDDVPYVITGGDQLYDLVGGKPVLKTGEFDLHGYDPDTEEPDYDIGYHLSVAAAVTAPVPEPASWTMMIGGFGVVGAMCRRVRRRPALVDRPDPS